MRFLSKIRTLYNYVYSGFQLGADFKSKWLLSSMLARIKMLKKTSRNKQLYKVIIRLGLYHRILMLRSVDIFIVHEVLWQRPYIHPEMKKNPPNCIVDLGAHIGLATLLFKVEFPNVKIHCYEPDPENFELLRLNTEGLPDVFLHQEAVGSQETEAILYIPEGRHSASSLRYPSKSHHVREVMCQVRTLDQILGSIRRPVDLIKFDIEGAEYDVFAASQMVHEVPWIVGEIKGTQFEVDRLIGLLPHHIPEVHWYAPSIAYIYLKLRRLSGYG